MYRQFTLFVSVILLSVTMCTQASYGLTIGPSRFEVRLPPGEIAGADYYVQNETDKPVHVIVEPENWFKDAYVYGDLDIKDWIEFDVYEFDLKPKEIKKLRLTIKVPKNVKGELVSQIFFTSLVSGTEDRPSGAIHARLGAVLYVAIKGTEIVDAKITNINVTDVKDEEKDKLRIDIDVRNNGNVHLRPAGKVFINTAGGQRLAELEIVSGMAVLPNQNFVYHALWEKPALKQGNYLFSSTINYGKEFDMEKNITFEKAFEVNESGMIKPK